MRQNFAGNTVVQIGSCDAGAVVQLTTHDRSVTVLGEARNGCVLVSEDDGTLSRIDAATGVTVLGDYTNGEADVQAVAGVDHEPMPTPTVWIIRTETVGRNGEPYYLVSGSKAHWDSTTDPSRAKQFKTEATATAYLRKIGATYCTPVLMPLP